MAVKSKITPWSYRKGASLLHRLPAGPKLVFLLLLSLAAFLPVHEYTSIIILTAIFFILILLSLIAGINPLQLLRGSGPLFLIVLGLFLLQGLEFSPFAFNTETLIKALLFCMRLGAAFAAASLLFSVTTPGEIRKSISRLETYLHLNKIHLSLYISLMLIFLHEFFALWEGLLLAWKSRGGRNNLSCLVKLIPLIIEKMMLNAAGKALALEARGIGISNWE